MTIRESITEFRLMAKEASGFVSDDTSLSDKYIYSVLLQARSVYYKQLMKKGESFSHEVVQSLNCVELKRSDISQCPLTPDSGCFWMESIKEIPTIIKLKGVTNDIGTRRFNYISWNDANSIATNRIKSSRDGHYYTYKVTRDGLKLFVLNDIFLEIVTAEGIAEDPIDFLLFCGSESARCFPMDEKWYSTRGEFDVILKLALDTYVRLKGARTNDIINNDREE